MQVGSKGLHYGYFGGLGADYAGHFGDDVVVDVEPGGEVAVGDVCEVAEDAFRCPGVEVLLHILLSQGWLEAEGVAAEVDAWFVVVVGSFGVG